MANEPESSQLTRILVQLVGRSVFPEDKLRKVILRTATSAKYLIAYNLCDGTRTRIEVAKAAKLDKDNFNKRATRWIQEGILFELGQGNTRRLLHLYPLAFEADLARGKSEETAHDEHS